MAKTIHVEVVSAEEKLLTAEAEMVSATLENGEVGIKPGHAHLLASLRPGEVRILHSNGGEEVFYVSGGIFEVIPTEVTILADTAIRAEELDEAAAMKAKKQAEKILSTKQSEFAYSKARTELARAAAQLQAIRKLRKKLRVG